MPENLKDSEKGTRRTHAEKAEKAPALAEVSSAALLMLSFVFSVLFRWLFLCYHLNYQKSEDPTLKTTRSHKAPAKHFRTKLGNGAALEGLDMRTFAGRRYGEVYHDMVAHCGGNPSAPQEVMIRRIAALNLWCDQQERALALGQEFDVSLYSTAANTLGRLCDKLGILPPQRNVTPTLTEYLDAVAVAAE